jgi:hypothetical protein
MLHSSRIRFRVDPRDVPLEKAARRLHLTLGDFQTKLPELLARGFPQPDPTTGMFDLAAIEAWMDARHSPSTSNGLTPRKSSINALEVCGERLRRLHHGL